MAIRDENYEGPFDEEGALDEISRLTREIERLAKAWEAKHAEQEKDRREAELWFGRAQYLTADYDRLTRELEEAREAITDAHDILADAPELNPSNYDHGEVVELNDAATEAYNRLARALATPPAEGGGDAD